MQGMHRDWALSHIGTELVTFQRLFDVRTPYRQERRDEDRSEESHLGQRFCSENL